MKLIGAFGTERRGQDAAFLMVLIFGTMPPPSAPPWAAS